MSPDFFTVGGVGSNQFVSDAIAQNKFGVGDDVAWNHGAHTFTFGADILRVQSNVYAPFEFGTMSNTQLSSRLARKHGHVLLPQARSEPPSLITITVGSGAKKVVRPVARGSYRPGRSSLILGSTR